MTRLHQILIGVLVAQLVLVGVVFWPRGGSAGASNAVLFQGLKGSDITSLTVSEKAGNSSKLARQGDKWVVPDAGDYPADATKLNSLADKLAALKGGQSVGRTTTTQSQLQVADDNFAKRIDFQAANGSKYTLFLGTVSGGSATHVRVGGQQDVYLTRDVSAYDVNSDVTTWIDAVYFSMPVEQAMTVTVKTAADNLTFNKDAKAAWIMQGLAAGEQTNDANVTSILSVVTSLRMDKPLGKQDQAAYGLAQPTAVLTVLTKNGTQETAHTLTIGAKDATGYFVKSPDSEYYVHVAEFILKDLVGRKRSDYLAQPTPAPTPASGPAAPPAGAPAATPTR
jgi:Domain of unknown function (DUF4340)